MQGLFKFLIVAIYQFYSWVTGWDQILVIPSSKADWYKEKHMEILHNASASTTETATQSHMLSFSHLNKSDCSRKNNRSLQPYSYPLVICHLRNLLLSNGKDSLNQECFLWLVSKVLYQNFTVAAAVPQECRSFHLHNKTSSWKSHRQSHKDFGQENIPRALKVQLTLSTLKWKALEVIAFSI